MRSIDFSRPNISISEHSDPTGNRASRLADLILKWQSSIDIYEGGAVLLTLKKAKRVAEMLTDKEVPSVRTLHNWRLKELLSGPIEFENEGQGRIGYYPDYLPVEIATNVELRYNYKLPQIAEARQEFMEEAEPFRTELSRVEVDDSGKVKEVNMSLNGTVILDYTFISEIVERESKLLEQVQDTSDTKERTQLLSQVNKLTRKREILATYSEIWSEKELRLKKLMA